MILTTMGLVPGHMVYAIFHPMVHYCDHCNRLVFPTSLYTIFLFGGHARSFICHVKSVQNISTIFVYVKIARHSICNLRFLIICLILCVFLFVYIFVIALPP